MDPSHNEISALPTNGTQRLPCFPAKQGHSKKIVIYEQGNRTPPEAKEPNFLSCDGIDFREYGATFPAIISYYKLLYLVLGIELRASALSLGFLYFFFFILREQSQQIVEAGFKLTTLLPQPSLVVGITDICHHAWLQLTIDVELPELLN